MYTNTNPVKQYVPTAVIRAPNGSGRSSLITAILANSLVPTQLPEHEQYVSTHWFPMEGVTVGLWACFGMKGFESRADTSYEIILAALPIDATDEQFDDMKDWLENRSPVLHKGLPVGDWGTPTTIICVLMQSDRKNQVTNNIGDKFQALATKHTFPYYETSATTGEGIFELQNAVLLAVNFPPLLKPKPKSSKCVIM